MTSAEMATKLADVNISEVKLLEIYRLIKNSLSSLDDGETFHRQTAWMIASHRSEENIVTGQKEPLRQLLGNWVQKLLNKEALRGLSQVDSGITPFNIAQNPNAAPPATEEEHVVPRFEKFLAESTLTTVDYREQLQDLLSELSTWIDTLGEAELDSLATEVLGAYGKSKRINKDSQFQLLKEVKVWFPQVANLYLALKTPLGRQAILDKLNTPSATIDEIIAAAKVLGHEAGIKGMLKGKSGMELATAKISAKIFLREEMRKAK